MHALEWLLLAVLVLVFPVYEALTHKRSRHALEANPDRKLAHYRWACLQLWAPTILLLGLHLSGQLSIDLFEARGSGPAWLMVGVALVVVYLSYSGWTLMRVANCDHLRGQTADALRSSAWMLPTTGHQAVWFVGPLSLTAGICEELLFRAYLLNWLAQAVPDTAALVLSSALFGLLHVYQGVGGVLRTALMGFVLGAVYLVTGSLVLVIVLHVAVDMYAGLLAWLCFRRASDPATMCPPTVHN